MIRPLVAEALGTCLLVATVVGSGIMATSLTSDVGLQLLINAVATVLVLGVLIAMLGEVSGAHFNPAVTVVAGLAPGTAAGYVAAQVVGGCSGTLLAHAMFSKALVQVSGHVRDGAGLWLGEVVATAGLVLVIHLLRGRPSTVVAVPAWIGAAYFFTSSTSFANPAVTLARSLTDSFSGIAPSSVPVFVLAQLVGATTGAGLARVLLPSQRMTTSREPSKVDI